MSWSWRGTWRRRGRSGAGGHRLRRFGQYGERNGLLVQLHVLHLFGFEGDGLGGLLGRQQRWADFAVDAALHGYAVEQLDGRPATLWDGEAQLAQVSARVDGESTSALELRVTDLTFPLLDCKRREIVLHVWFKWPEVFKKFSPVCKMGFP